jgi:FkbM family methyltransferase
MPYHERLRYLEFQSLLNYKQGLVVYDIGANIGEFARFSARFPSVSEVYCFEPGKKVFWELRNRTEKFRNIKCYQLALGDKNGRQKMYVNAFSVSSSMLPMESIHMEEFPQSRDIYEEEVQVVTLKQAVDEHNLLPPDFIKMDVQGFEDRVIRGGENIVKMSRYCMLELSLTRLYEGSLLIDEVNSLMRRLGFRLVKIVGKVVGKSGEILQLDGVYRNDNALGLRP